MAPFYSSVPVSHDSVTVSQHAQYQDPETEAAKWNSAIINYIMCACAFPTETCQNVCWPTGISYLTAVLVCTTTDLVHQAPKL